MSTAGLQRSSPLPLYHQLKEILLARIESGDLQPGDRLPGEHDLCRLYGVSRTVVRQALGEHEHEHEGRAIRRRGREPSSHRPRRRGRFPSFSGLAEDVARRGGSLRSEVRTLETVPVAGGGRQGAAAVGGRPVIVHERLRFVDERPWCVPTTHIPHALCPGLIEEDSHQAVPLYGLLEGKYGIAVARGRWSIEVVEAGPALARDLGLATGSPLLLLGHEVLVADLAGEGRAGPVCHLARGGR